LDDSDAAGEVGSVENLFLIRSTWGCQITPSVRSCEKIEKSGTDSPFRAGQLRIFKRLRGAKTVSGPGFSIFSQLLTLGVIWQPQVTG